VKQNVAYLDFKRGNDKEKQREADSHSRMTDDEKQTLRTVIQPDTRGSDLVIQTEQQQPMKVDFVEHDAEEEIRNILNKGESNVPL